MLSDALEGAINLVATVALAMPASRRVRRTMTTPSLYRREHFSGIGTLTSSR
jgi:hypothetical protein